MSRLPHLDRSEDRVSGALAYVIGSAMQLDDDTLSLLRLTAYGRAARDAQDEFGHHPHTLAQLPLAARILEVVECFRARVSAGPRNADATASVIAWMRQTGGRFDADVLDTLTMLTCKPEDHAGR